MNQTTNDILELLRKSDNPISKTEISEILSVAPDTVNRTLRILLDRNEIRRIRFGRQMKYENYSNFTISGEEMLPSASDFSKIESHRELIAYLTNANARLSRTTVLCQYTRLDAVVNIISDRSWYLGSPRTMNDGLELQQGLEGRDDIFFSSFMAEQRESIAMWSMYAQPWEDGIMISIPVKTFKQWMKEIKKVYRADLRTKKADREDFVYLNKARVTAARVAYISQNRSGEIQSLTCGGAKNECLKPDPKMDPSLVGYIKDEAWSYEKEVRLRVDLGAGIAYKGVAVDVPDYVVDAMVITKGPRFEGELLDRMREKVNCKVATEASLFYNKHHFTTF